MNNCFPEDAKHKIKKTLAVINLADDCRPDGPIKPAIGGPPIVREPVSVPIIVSPPVSATPVSQPLPSPIRNIVIDPTEKVTLKQESVSFPNPGRGSNFEAAEIISGVDDVLAHLASTLAFYAAEIAKAEENKAETIEGFMWQIAIYVELMIEAAIAAGFHGVAMVLAAVWKAILVAWSVVKAAMAAITASTNLTELATCEVPHFHTVILPQLSNSSNEVAEALKAFTESITELAQSVIDDIGNIILDIAIIIFCAKNIALLTLMLAKQLEQYDIFIADMGERIVNTEASVLAGVEEMLVVDEGRVFVQEKEAVQDEVLQASVEDLIIHVEVPA